MTIRLTWKRVIVTLLGIFALGMAYAWSGAFNVAASSGHWAVTDWFLHWVMRNSVQTRAALTVPDDAADASGLVSAAGYYATSCASCHGAPGVRPLPLMQKATPPAPDLAKNAKEWTDKQLYWILEHGVKFSGMPAWGAKDRPDEVRRMVAFVRRLPKMSPQEYRLLAGSNAQGFGAANGRFDSCAGCHGSDGLGRGQKDIPVLAGQNPGYLAAALEAYATGRRQSAVMGNAAAQLTPEERVALARRFAAMPNGIGGAVRPTRDAAALRIIERGLPDQQLPACRSCHTPGMANRYPVIDGQRAGYIADRLRQWRGQKEVVDARKSQATMPVIARRIPEDMIEPIARALAGK
ncbi:cytochrome C [Sphingomonas sp. Leaf407]|uniref:c-type cytochrome n=1 Tax=unclassified Sphingomonas TaxID=196159 RepID=UPI0006F80651|nr:MULTISPECIES: c-type cytochrome [unclassified Sphingomonas]KQN40627.1 cytochrome C [Sphingomonas sp. Leaf42]KQT29983.1 cytochrome C [Sphingomonas sp. Leaf407]